MVGLVVWLFFVCCSRMCVHTIVQTLRDPTGIPRSTYIEEDQSINVVVENSLILSLVTLLRYSLPLDSGPRLITALRFNVAGGRTP